MYVCLSVCLCIRKISQKRINLSTQFLGWEISSTRSPSLLILREIRFKMAEHWRPSWKTHFPSLWPNQWSDLSEIWYVGSQKPSPQHTLRILRYRAISRYRGRSRYSRYCATSLKCYNYLSIGRISKCNISKRSEFHNHSKDSIRFNRFWKIFSKTDFDRSFLGSVNHICICRA